SVESCPSAPGRNNLLPEPNGRCHADYNRPNAGPRRQTHPPGAECMGKERIDFEAEIKKPQPDWEKAVDLLSSLAMFEMLPALDALDPFTREEVRKNAWRILSAQRGWAGAYARIQFAVETVANRKLGALPVDLEARQVEDARQFLIDLLKPAQSRA